jgi:hypothetical protein
VCLQRPPMFGPLPVVGHIFCGRESSNGFSNAADGLVSMCRGNAEALAKYGPRGGRAVRMGGGGRFVWPRISLVAFFMSAAMLRDPTAQPPFNMLNNPLTGDSAVAAGVARLCRNTCNPYSLGEDHRGESVS